MRSGKENEHSLFMLEMYFAKRSNVGSDPLTSQQLVNEGIISLVLLN